MRPGPRRLLVHTPLERTNNVIRFVYDADLDTTAAAVIRHGDNVLFVINPEALNLPIWLRETVMNHLGAGGRDNHNDRNVVRLDHYRRPANQGALGALPAFGGFPIFTEVATKILTAI